MGIPPFAHLDVIVLKELHVTAPTVAAGIAPPGRVRVLLRYGRATAG
jgi:hypothetical protein